MHVARVIQVIPVVVAVQEIVLDVPDVNHLQQQLMQERKIKMPIPILIIIHNFFFGGQ